MYHEMNIFGFALDPIAKMPVIILKDSNGDNSVPIWISSSDSIAFAAELVGREMSVQSGRKDLLELLMDRLELKIDLIALESIQEGVFKSSISFVGKSGDIRLEVRVSEAMTMALKCKMPVMVSDAVLQQASSFDINDENLTREDNARRFVDFLDNLDPAAMGKYPM